MKNLPNNLWQSPVLKRRFAQEATFESNHGLPSRPFYWFCVPIADSMTGAVMLRNYEEGPLNPDPHEMQIQMAHDLREKLQRQLHHDGIWVVGWTHPPETWQAIRTDGDNCWRRLCMIWLDEDGDPQYTVESDEDFITMMQNGGADYYVQLCGNFRQHWEEAFGKKALKSDFCLTEGQTSKPVLETLR